MILSEKEVEFTLHRVSLLGIEIFFLIDNHQADSIKHKHTHTDLVAIKSCI